MNVHTAHTKVERIVRSARSSFYWPMRFAPIDQRRGMFAIYAFCSLSDAIADGPEPAEQRARLLFEWRQHVASLFEGRAPQAEGDAFAVCTALADVIARFTLPRAPFDAILDGLEMDVAEEMRGPPHAVLSTYCTRVAGAVGQLCLAIMGWRGRDADDFAMALGTAVQLTNILRDVEEDASLGRLYIPREALDASGIAAADPDIVLRDPKFADAWLGTALLAETRFHLAESLLPAQRRKQARIALAMLAVYRALLLRLKRRGWRPGAKRLSVPRPTTLWIALRHGLS